MTRFCRSVRKTFLTLFTFISIATTLALADARLPHVIGSNMVLQREMPIPVWGCADPNEQVSVEFAGQRVATTAGAEGRWMVRLGALKAGGPYKMTVRSGNTIELTNILTGEVWLCSGQSNMEMGIGIVANGREEIAAADHPRIRLFDVPKRSSGQTEFDVDTEWRICSPNSIASGGWEGFSADAYFFGREVHNQLDVPVGLIDASWGGSYIEPWTPPAGFAMVPKLTHIVDEIEQTNSDYREVFARALDEFEVWIHQARKSLADDGRVPPGLPDYPHHPFTQNEPYNYPWRPTGLYNGMIHPLIPFAIRGAIWYQGESNLADGMLYHKKMKALIGGWRKLWPQGDFPFYFVQLAPFRYEDWPTKDITPTSLPKMWEAQVASLSIPNTGMAVTTDIGDLNDIHPTNKQDVGKRLALWALAKTYGRTDLVYSGPLYKSMFVQDATIRVAFDHVGSGLTSSDGKPLTWFEIAGPEQRFYKADAEISGNAVLVWNNKVKKPVAVRFAWHQEGMPNLTNKEGLPASPFRTDNW